MYIDRERERERASHTCIWIYLQLKPHDRSSSHRRSLRRRRSSGNGRSRSRSRSRSSSSSSSSKWIGTVAAMVARAVLTELVARGNSSYNSNTTILECMQGVFACFKFKSSSTLTRLPALSNMQATCLHGRAHQYCQT